MIPAGAALRSVRLTVLAKCQRIAGIECSASRRYFVVMGPRNAQNRELTSALLSTLTSTARAMRRHRIREGGHAERAETGGRRFLATCTASRLAGSFR